MPNFPFVGVLGWDYYYWFVERGENKTQIDEVFRRYVGKNVIINITIEEVKE